MTSFTLNTTSTSTRTLNHFEDGIIGPNGALLILSGSAIGLTGSTTLLVDGSITAAQGSAIRTWPDATALSLTLGPNASVVSSSGYTTVSVAVSQSADITNNGAITGGFTGLLAVSNTAPATVNIFNFGTISGTFSGLTVGPDDGVARISNSGTINGGTSGIRLSSFEETPGVVSLKNTGTIIGQTASYAGRDGFTAEDSISNVTNSGHMEGAIIFGDLEDVYNGRLGTVNGDILGGGGNDTLRGGAEAEVLHGDGGNDLIGARGGDDQVDGGSGSDTLHGGRGDDDLRGGGKHDLLNGGRDDDTLTGEGGADTFQFSRAAGHDIITDFQDGTDVIDISALHVRNFNQLSNSGALSNTSEGTTIDFSEIGGTGSVYIDDILISSLSGADFIF